MDYTKCKVLKDANDNPTGQVVTPRAIMIYGSLFEKQMPRGETDAKKAKYQSSFIFHKAADLAPLKAAMEAVIGEKVTAASRKTTKVKIPFHKVTEEEQPKVFHALIAAGYNPEDYPVMLRSSNGYKPFIANPNTTECLDEEQVYDGRLCRANVNFYFYDHPTGGKGVSASVNSVQLLDQGPVLPRAGGGASTGSEFEAADVVEGASADSVFS
jgi:hypothetical protein